MPKRPCVAVYGHDQILLDTRQWVLEHAGYRVVTAQAFEGVRRASEREELSLLLLCHTLTPEERRVALAFAESVRPAVKKLSLTANAADGVLEERHEVCSLFDGPEALVRSVNRLLAQL